MTHLASLPVLIWLVVVDLRTHRLPDIGTLPLLGGSFVVSAVVHGVSSDSHSRAVVAAALEVAQKRDSGRSDDRPTLADVQVLVRDHVAKAAAIDQRVQHLERYLLGAGHQLVPASFASQHDADFPILSTKLVQN